MLSGVAVRVGELLAAALIAGFVLVAAAAAALASTSRPAVGGLADDASREMLALSAGMASAAAASGPDGFPGKQA